MIDPPAQSDPAPGAPDAPDVNPDDLPPPRRSFLFKAAAVVVGAIAVLIPSAAGLAVLLDPLRRKAGAAGFLRVTTVDALPTDGSPRKFPVLADKSDAWNKYPNSPIGAVYLVRKPDASILAFNTRCPHAGCYVDALPNGQGFHCPCHNSHFASDGSVQLGSPSPRGLDPLEINPIALKDGVIEVRFENFIAGTAERTPRT